MQFPRPRGPLSEHLLEHLTRPPHAFTSPQPSGNPLSGNDFHLTLFLCFEMHYGGLDGISDGWEWEPSLIAFRRSLEERFEAALVEKVAPVGPVADVASELRTLADDDTGPSLAAYMQSHATREQFLEFMIHRSAYHLKEADPHTWAIPRLGGRAKAAMVEIQADEYGSGSVERMHSHLFARAMQAVGLESRYGNYVQQIPGVTLATVNLMSMFGLNRRWRGAAVGHLALFEMTSSLPNRKYGNGLRRLGLDDASDFFDEHVEADAVHEVIAAHDMAGALAADDPALTGDIIFGARALLELDRAFADHLLERWARGLSSLLSSDVLSLPATSR